MFQVLTIKDKNLFRIEDDITGEVSYGANQEWYSGEFQRLAGCGPTTASMLVHYYRHKSDDIKKVPPLKSTILLLMEEIWEYVTPGKGGIPTVEIFCEKFKSYLDKEKIQYQLKTLLVPEEKEKRPSSAELLSYLKEALEKDRVIAFLNLCNGEETNLDRWHWVILFSIEFDPESNKLFAYIYDEGIIKKADLNLWLNSTSLGGGFAYLDY